MESFRSILEKRLPVLFDGATGTELYNRGIFINRCFEDANLSNPKLVTDLHREYLAAGASVLTTNSWGANAYKLKGHGLHDRVVEVNRRAAELARTVAGDSAYVAGSVGPLGVRIEPWGPTSFAEARAAFADQMRGLVEAGVDLFVLETFSDLSEQREAIHAAHDVAPDIPIVAHVAITPDSLTTLGMPVEWAIQQLNTWTVDVVGLNCSVGPQAMMSVYEKIRGITSLPISLQPNAGLPRLVDGRTIYMCTPEYMATFAKDFLNAGVLFVGGCCGTTPSHIRAMANAIRYRTAMARSENQMPQMPSIVTKSTSSTLSPSQQTVERVPLANKSEWSRKIAHGEMVTSVELLPPASVVADVVIEKARQLKLAGIDAINVPDGPRASARMSAILTCVLIEQRVGIETVLHYTCRDRNLLGMQSDLLGAHAIGLRNLLLITGDPPKLGDYPNATGVFDVDVIGLTNMAYRLNGGQDLGGRSIGTPTALSLGVGVNPVAADFALEMKRFRYKVEAGAEWAITQPVFDIGALYRFLEFADREGLRIPVVAGIWPLTSYRNAVFMHNEVPGVVIPETIMQRMQAAQSPEDARQTGVTIAREMVDRLGRDIQGVQVSAPFGRVDLALAVLGREVPVVPPRTNVSPRDSTITGVQGIVGIGQAPTH